MAGKGLAVRTLFSAGIAAVTGAAAARKQAEAKEAEARTANLLSAAAKMADFAEGVGALGTALAEIGHLGEADALALAEAARAVRQAGVRLERAAAAAGGGPAAAAA